MTDNSTLIYKNVKVVKAKSSQFQGYPGETESIFGSEAGSEAGSDWENEMISDDDEGTVGYNDERSECSTQRGSDTETSDVETDDVIRLFKKRTQQRSHLPSILIPETDFIAD